MSVALAVFVFAGCLLVSIGGSFVLAAGIDKIGARLALPAGLFGIVTALGANAPEIASAVTALVGGHHDLGLGIVFGSNIFNLAALLGLSAVVAGGIEISRPRLALEGGVAILILAVAAALLFGVIGPWLATALAVAVFLPYLVLLGLSPSRIRRYLPPGRPRAFLTDALVESRAEKPARPAEQSGRWTEPLLTALALVAIVGASFGMVRSALDLAAHWGLAHRVVGTLVLATLTGIPNVIAAVRLAVDRRGATVFSEALNSNTLNLVAGLFLPALVLGHGAPSGRTVAAVWWLVGMTVGALVLTGAARRLGPWGGAALIGVYLAFVGFVVFWE